MDESSGGIGLGDLLRALLSSVDERGRFGEDPRGFLGDRGLHGLTVADVREAVTMSADDLAPAAGVDVGVLTAPAPAAEPAEDAGTADPLDGAITEISRLIGFVDPDFAPEEFAAAVAPDDPPPDEEGGDAPPEEADGFFDPLVNDLKETADGTWEGLSAFGADQVVEGVVEAFEDLGQGGIDTLDRVDEELDEASADFDEGDIAAGALGSVAGALLSPVAAGAETAGDIAGDAAGAAVEATGDVLGFGTKIVAGAIGFSSEDAEAAGQAVEDAAGAVGEAVDEGIGYVGEGVGYVVEGAGEVVEGVGEVIDEGIEAIGDAADEVGDWLGL